MAMNWQAAIEKTVSGLGFDMVDIERATRGLLRVYIDRRQSGAEPAFITVDDCEKVTRQLQHVLEVEGFAYERLEVSSPGLDRPLKRDADYARFVGTEIELTLKMPLQGRKKFRGILQAAPADATDAAPWRLVFNDGKGEQALDFALSEVREARLVPVVDFKGRRGTASADDAEQRRSDGTSPSENGTQAMPRAAVDGELRQ